MNLVRDVQSKEMNSAYMEAPFDEGKLQLESEGYQIISLEQNAKLRMLKGRDSYVSQKGNWVREGFLYVSQRGKFLIKISPIIISSVEATNAHRNGNEFYLTEEQVEENLIDSIKLKDKDFSIPTRRFGGDKLTAYIFGTCARDYGDFLEDAGIKEMPVWVTKNIEDKPFVRQAWFGRVEDMSRLNGDGKVLYSDCGMRGVRESN